MSKSIKYQCAKCGSDKLQYNDDQIICESCGSAFAVSVGLPDFSHDSEFYWGELERETMRSLLKEDRPVQESLLAYLKDGKHNLEEYLTHYALDRRRAGWMFLTALPDNGRALDFGCGWGSLSLSLAYSQKYVVVSDVVPERVLMVKRRAQEMGYECAGCVSSGWPKLPFESNSFDLVALNGVLEWIPSSIKGNPREIQKVFLSEVCRVLKDDGQLYIGIENRYGASYFRGKREEHTKLKFISLLPRWLGHFYHRLVLRIPYRTYTYGRRGMQRLLSDSGFSQSKFFYPYPDYREFSKLVDLEDSSLIQHAFTPSTTRGRLFFMICRHTGLMKYFANSFGIVASKRKAIPSFVDNLILKLVKGNVIDSSSSPTRYHITGTALLSVVVDTSSGRFLISLPLDKKAELRLECDIESRRQILNNSLPAEVSNRIIDPGAGVFGRVSYKIERFSVGTPEKNSDSSAIMTNAFEWINKLHQATRHEALPDIAKRYDKSISVMVECLSTSDKNKYKHIVKLFDEIRRSLSHIHGDYHCLNLLYIDGNIDAVIDWDLSQKSAPAVWDVMAYLVQLKFNAGMTWGMAFASVSKDILDTNWVMHDIMQDAWNQLGLKEEDINFGILTFPLFQLWAKMEHGDGRTDVILEDLSDPIHELLLKLQRDK